MRQPRAPTGPVCPGYPGGLGLHVGEPPGQPLVGGLCAACRKEQEKGGRK